MRAKKPSRQSSLVRIRTFEESSCHIYSSCLLYRFASWPWTSYLTMSLHSFSKLDPNRSPKQTQSLMKPGARKLWARSSSNPNLSLGLILFRDQSFQKVHRRVEQFMKNCFFITKVKSLPPRGKTVLEKILRPDAVEKKSMKRTELPHKLLR